jgi:hypothetical protein
MTFGRAHRPFDDRPNGLAISGNYPRGLFGTPDDHRRTLRGATMEEQRTERPHRVLKSGRIIVGAKAPRIDCTVRDLSDAGARLVVPSSTFGVPVEFLLAIGNAPPRPCRVTRRTLSDIDVEFV